MTTDDIFDEYKKMLLSGFVPEVMIMATPEGTWLLTKDEEPCLLGEEADFDNIMIKGLHREQISTSSIL